MIRTISYGGGVQSTALLVLAAQGVIDYPVALLANVGDDSEHPATLAYVRDVATPFAAANGLELVVLDRIKRDGTKETLMGRLMKPGSRSLPIPVRMPDTGAPGNRSCTVDFKIKVIGRELKRRGATADAPAHVAVGISTDEHERAGRRKANPYEVVEYPLLDLGYSRADCQGIIRRAGLPVPPKSSCYFCPFHRAQTWAEMRRDEPELFAKAVDLERHLNVQRDRLGRDHVYLTRYGRPLDEAIPEAQATLPLFPDDEMGGECASGSCFT